MAIPFKFVEQPGLAVDGIVTDANGDHWILFPGAPYWQKVKREEMDAAVERFIKKLTPL